MKTFILILSSFYTLVLSAQQPNLLIKSTIEPMVKVDLMSEFPCGENGLGNFLNIKIKLN